jgi:hypothetical protein
MTSTIKIQILTRCENCNAEAYVPIGEAEDCQGHKYTRFVPCPFCGGSGIQRKWVSLQEFLEIVSRFEAEDLTEVNYHSLAEHEPISQLKDSLESSGLRY